MIYNKEDKRNIFKFMKIISKYRKQHLSATFFMLVQSLLTIISPYFLIKIIDDLIPNKKINILIGCIIVYLLIILFQNGCKLTSDYLYAFIGKRLVYDLRLKIIKHLQKLSGKFYCRANSGELLTTINSDVATVEEFATKMLFTFISDLVTSVVMFVFLLNLQWDLLIISLILQPLMFILQSKFNKKINTTVNNLRNKYGTLTGITEEYVTSMHSFNIQNARKHFFTKYFPVAKQFLKNGINLQLNFSLSMISVDIISSLITILVLGYGGYKVIIGTMTIGGLIAFNIYSQKLMTPVFRIAQLKMNIQETLVSLRKIFNLLDEHIDIKQDNKGYRSSKIIGKIEFKNVSFSYNKQGSVISKLNLIFQNNKITAIVGASGSGKTTITNLLLRLWDISEGNIFIDGKNIKDYNLKFLKKNISIVSQDVFIFNDTILNNITLSNNNVHMNKVIEAAKIADIYEFIMSLPEKFNTELGQRGLILSGGQKQKISIARAIIKNTAILILDEATSALDNISEFRVKKNIVNFLKNKTVIVVAHRLSTIEDADIIYTFDKGKIIEKGNHYELMKLKKIYYNLYMRNIN
jgi:ABC-type bacteriocin/lantibiotic exporter with double-glycine peptidase domain